MRLIDADALIEEIASMDISEQSKIFSVNMLRTAPTAYDVEKVVEQLEERRKRRTGVLSFILGETIKIVRKGGVE